MSGMTTYEDGTVRRHAIPQLILRGDDSVSSEESESSEDSMPQLIT